MVDHATFDFHKLQYETLLDALASVGLYPEDGLMALNSYENRVYQFTHDDNQQSVVKFYRPDRWQDGQIQEEHDFTLALKRANLAVAAPRVIEQNTLHHYQGYRFAIFPRLRARTFEMDNLRQLDALGELLGQVHNIGAAELYQQRPTINPQEQMRVAIDALKNCTEIPNGSKAHFFEALEQTQKAVLQHWHQDWQPCRLHGDAQASNLLYDEKALLVDFDDSQNGPAVQDLYLVLNGDQAEQQTQLGTLVECYEEHRTFNTAELRLIEPLRTTRMIHYMGWLAKRWSDPAFPRAFPWFAEAQYWQQQTQYLQQQQHALQQSPLTLQPQW